MTPPPRRSYIAAMGRVGADLLSTLNPVAAEPERACSRVRVRSPWEPAEACWLPVIPGTLMSANRGSGSLISIFFEWQASSERRPGISEEIR